MALLLKSKEVSSATPARDETYYFHDGSCVIQAEDYLFKVHKSLLERDSSFFRTMFSLPQNQVTSIPEEKSETSGVIKEGDSDENPIICQDSADNFIALCWVLYARPKDTSAQQYWDTVNIRRLVRVAAISHKYEFEHFRDWSLDLIDLHSSQNAGQLIPRCGGWNHVQRILNLAYECQRLPLAERIEREWLKKIQTSSAQELRTAFGAALDIAECSPHLRQFHGKVYYTYLKARGVFQGGPAIGPGAEVTEFVDDGLETFSKRRDTRLRQGFWSLMRLRLRLSVAPKINGNPSCPKHTTECVPGWDGWWKQKLEGISPPIYDPGDVLLRTQTILLAERGHSNRNSLRYSRTTNTGYNSQQVDTIVHCSSGAQQQMQEMAATFHDSLPDHFMIPR